MEKRIWKGRLLPNKLEAYKEIHDHIWPEMLEALEKQGICNYTIWNHGDEIIGYYECESFEEADKIKADLEVCKRWSEAMEEIMVLETNETTGKRTVYEKVFSFR